VFAGALLWAAGAGLGGRASGGSDSSVSRNPEVELTEIITLADRGRFEDAYERAVRLRSDAPTSAFGANGAAYALTYAGYLDEATRAIDDMLRSSPDYIEENAWWTPTALLYQRDIDRFLSALQRVDSPSARLYRALAEVERGRRAEALSHLIGVEQNAGDPVKFNGLSRALQASLADRRHEVPAMVRSIADQRRTAGDRDGEVTFKQAQILSLAGHVPAAVAMLDEAVAEGFVCVPCLEASSLLEPVRELPEYRRVRERAMARHLAFGQRFGLLKMK
jgi:tetratricopeptide (TPR) repeat protein